MKALTWQTVRGRGKSSRAIGWFGGEFYSHIDVLTPEGLLRGARSDVIQGIQPGYRDRPQNYEKWAACTRWTVEVTDEQYDKYWAYSKLQLGKPYDSRGLIETFVFGREWREDNAWWCSEEVAMNGEQAGIWVIPEEMTSVEPGDNVYIFVGMGAVRQAMAV
jgi:hypothetical protein